MVRKYENFGLLGKSPQFIQLLKTIEAASRCDVQVRLEGESGTGKELIVKHNFGKKYHKLNANEKEQVDNVVENLMSYHFIEPVKAKLIRLTEG